MFVSLSSESRCRFGIGAVSAGEFAPFVWLAMLGAEDYVLNADSAMNRLRTPGLCSTNSKESIFWLMLRRT